MIKTPKNCGTVTKGKSNSSNCSIDRCEFDPREIPLNGFNRFDPKYISIGPKALRDTSFTTTNLNKCATLRHGGRYGGSLTERLSNPVLKKASPPSVATVSKEFNAPNVNSTEIKSNIKTMHSFSNSSLTGNEKNNIGANHHHKRSTFQQTNDDKIKPENSFDRDIHKRIYSIEPPVCSASKYTHTKALAGSQKVSILSQPLPEIPPKTSQIQRNQQLLSASNLNKNRNVDNSGSYQIHSNQISTSVNKSVSPMMKVDQPPILPPKNRNRHTKSGVKTQAHSSYSTFGYDLRKIHTDRDICPDIFAQNLGHFDGHQHTTTSLQQSNHHQTLPPKSKNKTSHRTSVTKDYGHQVNIEGSSRSHSNVSNSHSFRPNFNQFNHSMTINNRSYNNYRDTTDFTGNYFNND